VIEGGTQFASAASVGHRRDEAIAAPPTSPVADSAHLKLSPQPEEQRDDEDACRARDNKIYNRAGS
jgi:hypothetical protein